jgi:hypothetical protein
VTASPKLGYPELEQGETVPEDAVNLIGRCLEGFASLAIVTDRDLAAPPVSPADGAMYLVAASPTGAWSGMAGKIAMFVVDHWRFVTPVEGVAMWVKDEDALLVYDGADWTDPTQDAVDAAVAAAIATLDLDALADVNAPAPAEGEVLMWDDIGGEWVSALPPGSGGGSGGTVPNGGGGGQVLAKGTGIDQDVDWFSLYEGIGDAPATTADLATWLNQGTSTVSDGTGAMVLKPQVDGLVRGREKATPSAPFDVYMRLDFDYLSTAGIANPITGVAGIVLRDNSDGELLLCGIYYERIGGDEQALHGAIVQRWTNASTFSNTPILKYSARPWKWVRVNVTSTTVTFYISSDGRNWIQVGTETIATFVDTIDRFGVAGVASTNMTEAVITVPYFSTSPPV